MKLRKWMLTALLVGLTLALLPVTALAAEADENGFVIKDGVLIRYQGPGGDIVIPDGVTRIGDGAFQAIGYGNGFREKITSVVIPEGVTSIGVCAFWGCIGLRSVKLPDSMRVLEESAFQDCTYLTSFDFGNGLTTIHRHAIRGCDFLTELYLPKSVVELEDYAIVWNRSLKTIEVDPENPNFTSEDGVLFNKDKTQLIRYPDNKLETSYTIPASVEKTGFLAFLSSNYLKNIEVEPGNKYYSSVDGVLFNKDQTNLIFYPGARKDVEYRVPEGTAKVSRCAFWESSLKQILLPDSITELDDNVFWGTESLERIRLPGGITRIPINAFYYCLNLKTIEIPSTVTVIEQEAFSRCPALINIFFTGTEAQWKAVKVDYTIPTEWDSDGNEALKRAIVGFGNNMPVQIPEPVVIAKGAMGDFGGEFGPAIEWTCEESEIVQENEEKAAVVSVVSNNLGEGQPLFVACYTQDNQLLGFTMLTNAGTAILPAGTHHTKLIWVGNNSSPLCENGLIQVGR